MKERAGRVTKTPKLRPTTDEESVTRPWTGSLLRQTIDEEHVTKPRTASLMSPAKGILLTPGTGAARRKNVSFGGLALNEKASKEKSHQVDPMVSSDVAQLSVTETIPQRRQTNLTKALYQARIAASKEPLDQQVGANQADDKIAPLKLNGEVKAKEEKNEDIGDSIDLADVPTDVTVDLNHPFSRSGQHWKAEYEKYYKKSDREMKKIIKYGQSVKTFAAKKDSEASYLGEKLTMELSKVAAMEAKVSALAAQLANARVKGSEDADQAKLVDELAKQTALAVRYQRKASMYRTALSKTNVAVADDEDGVETTTLSPTGNLLPQEASGQTEETGPLHAELEKCRDSAKRAEEKAKKLEAENSMLKRALARAEADAKSYEASRLVSEEIFKKREANFTASKEDCEARLIHITNEHEMLLRKFCLQKDSVENADDPTMAPSGSQKESRKSLTNGAEAPNGTIEKDNFQPIKSPYKAKAQPYVDIWTFGGQGDRVKNSPSRKKTAAMFDSTGLNFSILKEIDQNRIPEPEPQSPILPSNQATALHNPDPNLPNRHTKSDLPPEHSPVQDSSFHSQQAPLFFAPQPYKPSAARRMRDRRSNMASPRPSMVNLVLSPRKSCPSDQGPAKVDPQPTIFENTLATIESVHVDTPNLVSTRKAPTSAATGARRQTTLPPDRLAAAKARLKEKSMERITFGERKEGKTWRRVKADGKGELVGVGDESGGIGPP